MFGTSRFGTALFAEQAFHAEEAGAATDDEEEMENMSSDRIEPQEFGNATTIVVAVAGDTTLVTVANQWQHRSMIFEVRNTDANALDVFKVQLKAHHDGDWVDYQTTWTAGTPVGLRFASVDLATLAASSNGTAILNIYGAHDIRFLASSAVGTSAVSIEGALFGPVG